MEKNIYIEYLEKEKHWSICYNGEQYTRTSYLAARELIHEFMIDITVDTKAIA